MSVSVAAFPAGSSIIVSDSRISVSHAQVFVAAGILDDSGRDVVATHVTFEGVDDKSNPVDVTVRLDRSLVAAVAGALLTMNEMTEEI